METNPVLTKLGYSTRDRLVIIHTDDIGMCHASVQAYVELIEFGLISSAATMVPCSWFPLVASICRQNPDVDIGIHLTLTSEWDTYRWSPISTRDKSSGLIDEEGYFYRSSVAAQTHANAKAAQIELHAQLANAISSGIDVTHLDTHMLTVAHSKFIDSYIQLSLRYKLPFLFPRFDEMGFINLGLDIDTAKIAVKTIQFLEEQEIPLIDYATGLSLDEPQNRVEQAKKALSELPAGITHFIIHPSKDTPELRAITPDWQCRVGDYNTFMDEEMRTFINDIGLHIIGYKALKQLIH